MGSVQQIRVKWNNHQSNFPKVFNNLLHKNEFVDVTLACEGQKIKAHKVVLSACSPYFHSLFLENPCKHPIVIMRDYKYSEIEAVIEYIYQGEVNIARDNLRDFLRTAQSLQVRGLADDESSETNGDEIVDKNIPSKQQHVPEPEQRQPTLTRLLAEQNTYSQDSYNNAQRNSVVSHEQFVQTKTLKRDSFVHTPPKRQRLSEKPLTVPSQQNVPSSTATYQSVTMNNTENSSEVVAHDPIKVEMKSLSGEGFEETQDSAVDESQVLDQCLDSPEPESVLLDDDPEILEDEPDIMQFTHDNLSQDGRLSQGDSHDAYTSNLLSALRDTGTCASNSSPLSAGEDFGTRNQALFVRKTNTMLWRYFQEPMSEDYRVMCLLCGRLVARGLTTRNTYSNGNLVTHLKVHKDQYFEFKMSFVNAGKSS